MPDVFYQLVGGPLEAATLRTTVYVDGYNLYYGRLRGTGYKWLDLVALFDGILKVQSPHALLQEVKLFTAPALARFATHGQASTEAQHSYHRALAARHGPRFSITQGRHHFDKAGSSEPSFIAGVPFDKTRRSLVWKIVEKQTDVNLAMALYRDAAKGRVDQIVLCSNDSDAEPALQALREDFPDLVIGIVSTVRPRLDSPLGAAREISKSLTDRAHWTRKHLRDEELAQAQLPLRVATAKKPVDKPPHW